MQIDLNRYYFLSKEAEDKYQNSLSAISVLRDRESQVASNPDAVAKAIKAEVEDYETQYSCLTGNLESCSPQH